MTKVVTARLSDEVLDKVDQIAAIRNRSRAWILSRLIETAADKELEFRAFIQEGIDSIERGEYYTQEEMEAWFEERVANRERPIAAE